MRRRGVLLASLAVLVVAAVVLVTVFLAGRGDDVAAAAPTPSPSPSPSATALTASEVYQTILPSLVVVTVDESAAAADGSHDSGLGTGVVANADGSIMTANHVIDGATSIQVQFSDGTTSSATVIASDPTKDTAVLMPDTLPSIVVPAVMGGAVTVGSDVVAVGNPLGLIASTSEGVVSGLNRTVTGNNGITLDGLIQFDAAVNPGSSGGPLLNDKGQVVGLVTSLADPGKTGYFVGIGFAVPIGSALGVTGQGPGEEPER